MSLPDGLAFQEPENAPYIHINPKTNQVHLMMPITGGRFISSDNTCQAAATLKNFWGRGGRGESAVQVLQRYQRALEADIRLLEAHAPSSALLRAKQDRLSQIVMLLMQVEDLAADVNITQRLQGAFPRFPDAIQNIIRRAGNNLYPILLRPSDIDAWTRFEGAVCSFSRNQNWGQQDCISSLQNRLRQTRFAYPDTQYGAFIAQLRPQFPNGIPDNATLKRFKTQLGALCAQQGGESDFAEAHGTALTIENMRDILMLVDPDDEDFDPVADYTNALMQLCLSELSPVGFDNPQKFSNNAVGRENLSILSQLLIAQINVYALDHNLVQHHENFGQILDQHAQSMNPQLSDALISTIAEAARNGQSAHTNIFAFFNQNHAAFGLGAPLTQEQQSAIYQRLCENYKLIQDSPHFDEFLLTGDNPGIAFRSQGYIAIDFTQLLHEINPAHDATSPEGGPDLENSNTFVNAAPQSRQQSELVISAAEEHPVLVQEDEDFERVNLNLRQARILHSAAIRHSGRPEICPDSWHSTLSMTEILNTLEIPFESVQSLSGNGFEIRVSAESAQRIEQAEQDNANYLYLPPYMAANIYKEVRRVFGEDSAQYRSLLSRHSGLTRLRRAFDLLELDMPSIQALRDGHILQANPDLLEQVMDIQRPHLSKLLTPPVIHRLYHCATSAEKQGSQEAADAIKERILETPSLARKVRLILEALEIPYVDLMLSGDGARVTLLPAVELEVNAISAAIVDDPSFNPASAQWLHSGFGNLQPANPRAEQPAVEPQHRRFSPMADARRHAVASAETSLLNAYLQNFSDRLQPRQRFEVSEGLFIEKSSSGQMRFRDDNQKFVINAQGGAFSFFTSMDGQQRQREIDGQQEREHILSLLPMRHRNRLGTLDVLDRYERRLNCGEARVAIMKAYLRTRRRQRYTNEAYRFSLGANGRLVAINVSSRGGDVPSESHMGNVTLVSVLARIAQEQAAPQAQASDRRGRLQAQ